MRLWPVLQVRQRVPSPERLFQSMIEGLSRQRYFWTPCKTISTSIYLPDAPSRP